MKTSHFPLLNCLSAVAMTVFACSAAELFVSPQGVDSQPGTKQRPFGTLERARDRARELRKEGKASRETIIIWLRKGDYLRSSALELTEVDSGRAGTPTVWRSWGDGRARLLGGRRLKGFRPVNDPAVLAQLAPEAQGQVRVIDLRAQGITEFGEMKSRGFGRPLEPSHCELFYQGNPMCLARWPNQGNFEHIAGFPEEKAQADGHGGKIGRLEDGFLFAGDRPRRWSKPDGVWVHGYWAWDWANSYERVASLDTDKRLVKTHPPYGQYGFRKGQRYYFLNVLEELDQPGEWYLDREGGLLYFWPPGELTETQEVLLSLASEPLVRLRNSSWVTFQGVELEATRSSAVEIHGGTSNLVAGCVLRNLGNYGVRIEGGSGHGVLSCDVLETGDGGVSVSGGDRQTLKAAGHFVENCYFARQGRWSKCYVPAILMGGVGMRASHNEIHDHPHCAILFTGNDHLIEFNEIHHVALETGDVGAIYTGRDYTYRGNRIRFNYIHHTGGVGMGSMGVYMDDCVSGTEIFGNVFYKVQRAAFLGGGRDHQVVNNVFVECNPAVELDGRGLDRSPVWREMVDKTMRQRLQDVPLSRYRERYPEMKSLDQHYGAPEQAPIAGDAFKGVPPENNVVARNVCVGKWLNVYWNAKPEMLRVENNLTNAEAWLASPGETPRAVDFKLKGDAPAWAQGFQKIPAERIGLRSDALRTRLPGATKVALPGAATRK
jgi:hypothetical protein